MSGLVVRHLASSHRFLDSRPSLRIVCRSSARRLRSPSISSFRVAASAVVVNQKSFEGCSQEICIRGALLPPRGVGRLRLRKGTYSIQDSEWTSSGVRRANERSVLFRTSADFLPQDKEEKNPGINNQYFSPSRLVRENNCRLIEESDGGLGKKK